MKKIGLWCGAAALALGLSNLPALAQLDGRPRFGVPESVEAVNGAYDLHWEDFPPGSVNPRVVSFTWFYAKSPVDPDRQRIITLKRDDFSNFRDNWRTPGPFGFDWGIKTNRNKRRFLQSPTQLQASALVSNGHIPADSVVGILVRPKEKPQWNIELRVQKPGVSLEFRQDGNKLRISEGSVVIADNIPIALPGGAKWTWYEIGLQTRLGKDVEIRVRVFNEERTELLGQYKRAWRLENPLLRRDGGISLSGPADFAELYVDPWSARWADDNRNTLRWDTSHVPNGDYVLIAEVCDGNKVPRQIATDFRVRVRNQDRDDAD
ncbi:MAG: hypothetical protein ACO1SX_09660 [Actinomycetota bacterium]